MIHGDIKPVNILLDKMKNAFISDYGTVKIAEKSLQTLSGGIYTEICAP